MNAPHPLAILREKNGLEWWEWNRPSDGLLQIELTGRGVLTDAEVEEMEGEFMTPSHFELLLDFDCDVYKPREESALEILYGVTSDDPQDRLLVSFRRGVLSQENCDIARDNLKGAVRDSESRGAAAGVLDVSKLHPNRRNLVEYRRTKFWAHYLKENGRVSGMHVCNPVMTGVVGYMDARPINPYCRETEYTGRFPEKFRAAFPLLEQVSEAFREVAPKRWSAQREFIKENRIDEKGWLIADTAFTTVTVNRNFRTGLHRDAGDLKEGYGNIIVLEGGDPYEGGYTVFPKFRVAMNVRTGDFTGMDVHEFHGNTEITPSDPSRPDYERVAIVCYCRAGLRKCGTREEEQEKRSSAVLGTAKGRLSDEEGADEGVLGIFSED